MYPALEEAERVLAASPSPLRHVIILTDGLTNAGDFPGLVAKMAKERITVSTVSIGEDADAKLLQTLASLGGGRAYATNDPRDVPRIFMTETNLVSRGLLVEKGFFPQLGSAGEMLRGVDLGSMPALKGFVLSYAKQGAETNLSALYDAPLLASWRYGLGRTAAFTSDMRGRWSASWLAWSQFPRFAAQLVRWLERSSGSEVLHPRLSLDNGRAAISVDAYDSVGKFVDGLSISGVVIGPEGDRTEIAVPQKGPGLYEAGIDAGREGDYMVSLSASGENAAPTTFGMSIPYSDEYRMRGVNVGLLSQLSAATGGRLIASASDAAGLAALLKREPGATGVGDTAWQWLILAGLLLFFLDIVVRRLVVPEGLRERIAARLRGLRPEAGPSYEDLAVMVKKAREEERSKIRQRIAGSVREGSLDADLAAYLYIARLHSRRAEKEETKK
jgi:hypothetical protein